MIGSPRAVGRALAALLLAGQATGCTKSDPAQGADDDDGVVAALVSDFRWSFRKASKFRAALPLASLETTAKVTARDRKTIAEATAFLRQTMAETRAFEASLSSADKARVTAGLDARLSAALGRFALDTDFASCADATYKDMRAALGLDYLAWNGVNVSILAGVYEDLNRPTYYERLLELIDQKDCDDERCESAKVVYAEGLAVMRTPAWRQQVDGYVQRVGNNLVKGGHDPARLKDEVMSMASRWPSCLAMISLQLSEKISADVTVARGLHLLAALKAMPRSAEEAAQDVPIDRVPLESGHPIRGSHADGWGNNYGADRVGDRIKLVSAGPDGQFGNEDDLDVGAYSN